MIRRKRVSMLLAVCNLDKVGVYLLDSVSNVPDLVQKFEVSLTTYFGHGKR